MGEYRTWEGGYVLRDARRRDVYVIRKQILDKRYKVSTRCHTLRAAMEQLKRFEADPEAYSPTGVSRDPRKAPIYLDEQLAEAHLKWCRDEKKNSAKWLAKQKTYVSWWAEQLAGVDLRRASLAVHILPAVDKESGARAHRIAVLKGLYSWLRKERHAIGAAEDPTFGTLKVPQAQPEQWKREKSIAKDDYEKVRTYFASKFEEQPSSAAQHWRDAMTVQAGTGWHTTELQRFAEQGRIEPYPGRDASVAGVLVCPQTKGGEPLRTAVSAEVLEAAKRVRKWGSLSIEKYGLAVRAACDVLEMETFTPGQFRHSVATWAVNQGADPAQVAAFLNHKSPRTTRRFYATHAVPAKVPTLS